MAVDYTPSFDPADVDSDYGSTGGDITVPTFTANMKPFRFWCQRALPLVYDDSLSYYEVLCKIVDQMNGFLTDLQTATGSIEEFAEQFVTNQTFLNNMAAQLGQDVDTLETYINERMEDFTTAYEQLQSYVNNYFDNLDVQTEINSKLDEMADDGTFNTLFNPVITAWMTEKTAQIDTAISNQDAIQAEQNARISVLEGRMDGFSSLPSGSTSGNAELLDIRTNFLGETYPTAGDAVRASDMITSGFQSIGFTRLEDWDGNEESSTYDTIVFDVAAYKGGHVVVIANTENFVQRINDAYGASLYGSNVSGKTVDNTAVGYPFPDGYSGFTNPVFKNYTVLSTSIQGEERIMLQLSIPNDFPFQYLKLGGIEKIPHTTHTTPEAIVYATSWSKTPVDATLTIAGAAADAKSTGDAISSINNSLDVLNNTVNETTEQPGNLLDMATVKIGTNWIGQSAAGRAVVYANVNPNTLYHIVIPENANIQSVDAIEKPSVSSGTAIRSTNLVTTGTPSADITLTTQAGTSVICIQFSKGSIAITEEDLEGYNPYIGTKSGSVTAIDLVARGSSLPWRGKTMVWLGTSIPAAGKYDMPVSYPLMVGDILEATVHNEAVGSSALHCKDPNRINTSNPYGFLSNFEAVSRCITNSLAEMNWIIEHYNDSAVFTQNVPATLSDADKEFIRSCSWETKLNKYFNNNDFPDLWVIDHGHNDIPSAASEATYSEKESISGTNHNGFYSAGTFIESLASSYIEYDVSNELYIWISGTFGSWYDVYDIYDSDNNNIGYTRYATETEVTNLRVDVSKATTLRVSNINTLISTVQVQKLKYPMYNSLYSFQGGFDFIVNKIFTYNPRARIIIIGEYENQKYPTISENQLIAANRWEIPIYKQWENLGWSQMPILSNGQYMSMLNIIIPDNLHPHTDQTGFALRTMAQNISAWLMTIR